MSKININACYDPVTNRTIIDHIEPKSKGGEAVECNPCQTIYFERSSITFNKQKKVRKEYILPACVQRIYTFYALELMYNQMKMGAYNQWFSQEQIDEIEIELEIFANKLKVHLLEVVEFSILSEVRYTKVESSYRVDKHLFSKRENTAIKKIYSKGRMGSNRILRKMFPQPKDRIKMALTAFNLTWEPTYGGAKWADGCEAWLKLYEAKELNDLIFWIDRIYDLQHNSGVLFNKHIEYMDLDYLVKEALDRKRYARNVHDVIFKQLYSNQHCTGLLPQVLPKYYKLFTKYLRRFSKQNNKKLYELEVVNNNGFFTFSKLRRGHVERSKQPKILKYEGYIK